MPVRSLPPRGRRINTGLLTEINRRIAGLVVDGTPAVEVENVETQVGEDNDDNDSIE